MTGIQVITLDTADEGAINGSEYDKWLQRDIAAILPPPIAPGPEAKGDPYEVLMVPRPAMWRGLPPSELLRFEVPRERTAMIRKLRTETDAAYVLGGWPLVDQLAAGVFGLHQWTNRQRSVGRRGASGNDLIEAMRHDVPTDRRDLFAAFEEVRRELIARATACRTLLRDYAAIRAYDEELKACDEVTINEGRRYLSTAATDNNAVRQAIFTEGAQSLIGPEGRGLVRAAETLAGPMRSLQEAKEAFERTSPARNLAEGVLWLALLRHAGLGRAAAEATEAYAKLAGRDEGRRAAAQRLARAAGDFQARFAELAVRYPILFKVAGELDRGENALRVATVDALRDALEASAELREILMETPDKVWRFPGLINRSLHRGFAAHAAFASRVAADQLERENAMPPFARLNLGIQLLSSALMFVPAPPVQVATAVATVLGDAAEMLESYFRTKEQKLGFRAAIDPGKALGPDGSYASTVVQAAFVAIGILPVRGAVKEWASQGTEEAVRAAELRTAVLGVAQ